MSSTRSNKGKAKRKERSYDLERDEQDGDVTPEQEQMVTSHQRTQNQEGTPNSIVTNNRLTQRELDYPLKSDISVSLVVENGEYNLKLTSVPTDNQMTHHAHTAAMLLSQGELLCKLGHKLLSELGTHHESKTYRTLNFLI
ncbi:hypothetical protein P8452_60028 [Trifolium repens]|nr:hypothetical protein P8452_60028 [Trifolium repens]